MRKKRSDLQLVFRLITLVKPLVLQLLLAISLGVIGFLSAIFIPVLGGYALIHVLNYKIPISISTLFILIIILALLRGFLRYGEQALNHFIAFKILALVRDYLFKALRRLAPAKLDGHDKGNLISIITSDIELLEVFYAHTISPVMIAIIVSIIMTLFFMQIHFTLGILALCAYLILGLLAPVITSLKGKGTGIRFRNAIGSLNSLVLDTLKGIKETIQYQENEVRLKVLQDQTKVCVQAQKKLNSLEALNLAFTNTLILSFSILMLFASLFLFQNNLIKIEGIILATIAMISSFGPVIALSNLANNLLQTFACGHRILDILDEVPVVIENTTGYEIQYNDLSAHNINFSYTNEKILSDFSINLPKNQIVGIHGKSGCGKSTLLKLLMRFYDVNQGKIMIDNKNLSQIKTSSLRSIQSYITQDTHIFHDSIENNLRIVNPCTTEKAMIQACKNAAIHDFIISLPHGYKTNVGEAGIQLSAGERQRLGIVRAFLYDSPILFLDEPTSNLDSLNEGLILKTLYEQRKQKTIVLVSHRKSTLRIANQLITIDQGRVS